MHYVLLLLLAIISQILVSWAGSILHSIGTEEIKYATFTFSDDRKMPMSTNILINICFPNVVIVFIELVVQKYKLYNVGDNLILYTVFFYMFRYVLICLILRRKELYNYAYELALALVGIGISFVLIQYFFSSEETLIITASELREELWFIIIVVLYKFIKLITDKYVLQDTVLTKTQIERYIIHKFIIFYRRYNDLFDLSWKTRYLCIYTYAVMIFEDYNRGPITRRIENVLCLLEHKEKTLGIMQVKSMRPLSDKDSVVLFYNDLLGMSNENLIEGNPYEQAWEYNNDNSYADSVCYIFEVLCRYIDEIPRYREEFYMRYEKADLESSFDKKIERLGKMHREGILSEVEYTEEKNKIIKEIHNM